MSNSFAIPWTVACQVPLSMGFPRQEYGSGLPFPSGDLPDPGRSVSCISSRFFITDSPKCSLHSNGTVAPRYPPLSVQFSQLLSCVRLCDPMNHSTTGLPVHHQLLEFTQTHVHRVGDAIQPSHPLSSPSPPAPNPSQHQGLFQWVNS